MSGGGAYVVEVDVVPDVGLALQGEGSLRRELHQQRGTAVVARPSTNKPMKAANDERIPNPFAASEESTERDAWRRRRSEKNEGPCREAFPGTIEQKKSSCSLHRRHRKRKAHATRERHSHGLRLVEEPARLEAAEEVADALALHAHVRREHEVADGQRDGVDAEPALVQERRQPGGTRDS